MAHFVESWRIKALDARTLPGHRPGKYVKRVVQSRKIIPSVNTQNRPAMIT
jgi:hypothetical protein